jgi:hypothetical protein
MNKHGLILLFGAIAVSGLFLYRVYYRKPILIFSSAGCDSSALDPYSAPSERILSQGWKYGFILSVEGFVKVNCGAQVVGSYTLNSDVLRLNYKEVIREGYLADCLCTRKVIYKFSNLPKKDYLISIVALE